MFFKLLLYFAVIANTTTVDRIAASVNNEIITQSDVEKYILLFPVFQEKNETKEVFFQRVLNILITVKIVYLDNLQESNIVDSDLEMEQTIIKKVGSIEQLLQILHLYDMEWKDFKNYIKEYAVYEKVLREKYSTKLTIPFNDIESFYQTDYIAVQKQLHLEPRSLAEMAPLLGQYLRQIHMIEKLEQWLKELKSSYKIEVISRSPQ